MLTARDAEILRLRTILLETEDSASADLSKSRRDNRNTDSLIASLRSTIEDLSSRLSTNETALSEALLAAEMEKANAGDMKSRAEAYMAEITRLSHFEANLRKEVEEVRKSSADSELKVQAMEKRVRVLEEDKELLNVALESKQVELTLLQRQLGTTAGRGGLTASTSKTISRRPSSVLSNASTTTTSKRNSWIPPTPTRRGGTPTTTAIMNGGVPSTPSRSRVVGAGNGRCETPSTAKAKGKVQPLGTSTKHNKTPEKRISRGQLEKAADGRNGENGGKNGVGNGGLTRQSSLPVLRRSAADSGRNLNRPESVVE